MYIAISMKFIFICIYKWIYENRHVYVSVQIVWVYLGMGVVESYTLGNGNKDVKWEKENKYAYAYRCMTKNVGSCKQVYIEIRTSM